MKYWNKDKKIRQKHWYPVARKSALDYQELKRELQLHDSPGRFYLYFAGAYIWFEREQDAVFFALKQV